jgi:hypothetical protein
MRQKSSISHFFSDEKNKASVLRFLGEYYKSSNTEEPKHDLAVDTASFLQPCYDPLFYSVGAPNSDEFSTRIR